MTGLIILTGLAAHANETLNVAEDTTVSVGLIDDFKSVKKFNFFNTNNIWAKLDAIERVLSEKRMNMEIIVNNKTLENGLRVIQLETAVGAAMKCFENAIGNDYLKFD